MVAQNKLAILLVFLTLHRLSLAALLVVGVDMLRVVHADTLDLMMEVVVP